MFARLQNNEGATASEEGFALLAVLGFLLLFAMILTPFAVSSRTEALTTSYRIERDRLRSFSEAIGRYLGWRLSTDASLKHNAESGALRLVECGFSRANLQISIVPHARLISLNAADLSLLQSGFETLGLHGDAAVQAASFVIRSRTPFASSTVLNNESLQIIKNSPFENVSEIQDFVLKIDASLRELNNVFSVYEGYSTLSNKENDLERRPSRYFSISIVATKGFSRGSDVAVYAVGGPDSAIKRISTYDDLERDRSEGSSEECSSILNTGEQSMFTEMLE